MAPSPKFLVLASTAAHSGKSAIAIGLAEQLRDRGLDIAYGKPLGNYASKRDQPVDEEEDVKLLAAALELPPARIGTPVAYLNPTTLERALQGEPPRDAIAQLARYRELDAEVVIVEAPGTLDEGKLFGLSARRIAEVLDASVLLVERGRSLAADAVLAAREQFADRLAGVAFNDVTPERQASLQPLCDFVERQGIPALGTIPRHELLASVSVRELAKQLNARILCCSDRLDLLVERLTIGAMNVNSALRYFRGRRNLAVITGGDRSDLQLAAMETSAHCLILTGQVQPQDYVLQRAEALEVPILAVDLDTLTTVQIVEATFACARIQEPIQVECARELMRQHFDLGRLLEAIDCKPTVSA